MIIRSVGSWRSLAYVVLALSASALTGCAAWAQSASADPLIALAERLDRKMPGSNVGLLLDASGSMSGRFATVRAAALRFADGMGSGETLTARAFAANITQPISGKGAEARTRLDAGLPREPMKGTGTDLGLALSKALDDLDRPDAAPVQALFVLTDGLHQPPADSPFSREFAYDPDWLGLRRRAAALAKQSRLIVYGLGIGSETDIGVLRLVFPAHNVEILSGDAASAGSAMSDLQRQLRLVRLKTLLERDIEQGAVTVAAQYGSERKTDRTMAVPIVIHNAHQALPVTITDLRIEGAAGASAGSSATLDAPSSVRLGPDARSTVTLNVRLNRDLPRWAPGRRRIEIGGSWQPTMKVEFDDRVALGMLHLASKPRLESEATSARIGVEYGKPWWVIIGLAVGLVLTAAGWKKRVLMLPPVGLRGTVAVQGRPEGLAARGTDRVTVGPPTADIPLPGIGSGGESVELYLGRDGDYARMALHTGDFAVSVNGEAVSGERVLSDGDTVTLGNSEFVVLDDGRALVCLRRPIVFVMPLLAFLALAIYLLII